MSIGQVKVDPTTPDSISKVIFDTWTTDADGALLAAALVSDDPSRRALGAMIQAFATAIDAALTGTVASGPYVPTERTLTGASPVRVQGDNATHALIADLTISFGLAGQTAGDLLYYSGSAWTRLAIGSSAQVLGISGGAPAWRTLTYSDVGADAAGAAAAALALAEAHTITAGAGLTGGGALSTNPTLNVVANADGSIVVNADDLQVGVLATDAQHGTRGGGTLHAAATASTAGFLSAAAQSVGGAKTFQDADTSLKNTTAATSGVPNRTSPKLQFVADYWNGSATVTCTDSLQMTAGPTGADFNSAIDVVQNGYRTVRFLQNSFQIQSAIVVGRGGSNAVALGSAEGYGNYFEWFGNFAMGVSGAATDPGYSGATGHGFTLVSKWWDASGNVRFGATNVDPALGTWGSVQVDGKTYAAGGLRVDVGSDATGDLLVRKSTNYLGRIAAGASGYLLTSNGAGTEPTWQAPPTSGISNTINQTWSFAGALKDYTADAAWSTDPEWGFLSSTTYTGHLGDGSGGTTPFFWVALPGRVGGTSGCKRSGSSSLLLGIPNATSTQVFPETTSTSGGPCIVVPLPYANDITVEFTLNSNLPAYNIAMGALATITRQASGNTFQQLAGFKLTRRYDAILGWQTEHAAGVFGTYATATTAASWVTSTTYQRRVRFHIRVHGAAVQGSNVGTLSAFTVLRGDVSPLFWNGTEGAYILTLGLYGNGNTSGANIEIQNLVVTGTRVVC